MTKTAFVGCCSTLAITVFTVAGLFSSPCFAQQRVDNPVAEFAGLDKVTARITKFDVKINETVQFGTLQVTPKICNTSASNDDPLTTGFIQVDETTLDKKVHKVFSGWMFADSPGLNAVEHPIYDIWLVSCKGGKRPPPSETDLNASKGIDDPANPRFQEDDRKGVKVEEENAPDSGSAAGPDDTPAD